MDQHTDLCRARPTEDHTNHLSILQKHLQPTKSLCHHKTMDYRVFSHQTRNLSRRHSLPLDLPDLLQSHERMAKAITTSYHFQVPLQGTKRLPQVGKLYLERFIFRLFEHLETQFFDSSVCQTFRPWGLLQ